MAVWAERKPRITNQDGGSRVADCEMGHVLAAAALSVVNPVQKAAINPAFGPCRWLDDAARDRVPFRDQRAETER
jgi:hypothetical protein